MAARSCGGEENTGTANTSSVTDGWLIHCALLPSLCLPPSRLCCESAKTSCPPSLIALCQTAEWCLNIYDGCISHGDILYLHFFLMAIFGTVVAKLIDLLASTLSVLKAAKMFLKPSLEELSEKQVFIKEAHFSKFQTGDCLVVKDPQCHVCDLALC